MNFKIITVKDLIEWLSKADETLPVELMIESVGAGQFQFLMTDMAVVTDGRGIPQSVVLIREPMETPNDQP